jgi:hypothetical protein
MRRSDPAFYESALVRIKLIILILGLTGAVFLAIWKDVRFGGGFLIGAAASYLSFWRWQRVVESISGAKVRRSPWLLAIRFVVLMAAGYVIIMLTGFNAAAAVIGLLLPGAAVTIEILYELIHGT